MLAQSDLDPNWSLVVFILGARDRHDCLNIAFVGCLLDCPLFPPAWPACVVMIARASFPPSIRAKLVSFTVPTCYCMYCTQYVSGEFCPFSPTIKVTGGVRKERHTVRGMALRTRTIGLPRSHLFGSIYAFDIIPLHATLPGYCS